MPLLACYEVPGARQLCLLLGGTDACLDWQVNGASPSDVSAQCSLSAGSVHTLRSAMPLAARSVYTEPSVEEYRAAGLKDAPDEWCPGK